MIAAAHMLAGAAVATSIPAPALALPLALASHYILDAIPHREYDVSYRRIADAQKRRKQFWIDFLKFGADTGSGMLAVGLLTGWNPLVLSAALLAFSPDGLHILDDVITRRRGGVYAEFGKSPYTRSDPLPLRALALQRNVHMAVHWRDRDNVPPLVGWPTQIAAIFLLALFLIVS